jgi:hypothetical protein
MASRGIGEVFEEQPFESCFPFFQCFRHGGKMAFGLLDSLLAAAQISHRQGVSV